ncbi:MAG: glycine cleavage system aminomethyltransferase GcvT [Nitrospira sp. SB0677_bin_15]|nr:glycine cleavage system aminomethyltransferase GcvT [Nitrospira sp. SB0667_bin_9]MYD31279.1 glycine cleavage system aminomethyltransferase GcvT [Nitrospira sp. SB0661_bin_20]MYG41114.1 glycine cleavage system aminomethyltransferase GcvT [Nitrospira sp. SB0677_bin_15]MYH01724.1 glycine cleavage system aminomethyltransferase GcvT [Nitrospira sp. SB0675_bin_23]MYJ22824.1 glycine cleavage system aminomethyltransferase GcvT [Nitrospira sp. SB0673_bin_12]
MKQTVLHEAHVARKAKIVDFAGWAMPLQYSGVLDEYHAVRASAGLFDVSHMGRLHVEGTGAVSFLQRVTTNDVQRVGTMGAQYSMICNPDGGVKDDIFVYRLGAEEFLLCVNASNLDKIRRWLFQQQGQQQGEVRIVDQSETMAQLALQGPASKPLLQAHVQSSLDELKPRRCLRETIGGVECLVARTGYTGELGYELYVTATQVRHVWDRLMQAGEGFGVKPAGLGARDLLRLDMGYLLYGNDLTEATTPIEASAKWVVNFDKGAFIGEPVLKQQVREGPSRCLVAFELLEKAVPRHDMPLFAEDKQVGTVTSGNLSPILQKGIGLGYVEPAYAEAGMVFDVEIRGRRIPAQVVALPFYKRPKPPV